MAALSSGSLGTGVFVKVLLCLFHIFLRDPVRRSAAVFFISVSLVAADLPFCFTHLFFILALLLVKQKVMPSGSRHLSSFLCVKTEILKSISGISLLIYLVFFSLFMKSQRLVKEIQETRPPAIQCSRTTGKTVRRDRSYNSCS